MVSQATVQAKANYGYGKSAAALGAPCPQYRPNGSGAPIASGNLVGTPTALFDTSPSMSQKTPSSYGKADSWYGAFSETGVLVGDYLVDATYGTFFVASLELFRPARMVRCNQVISVGRPGDPVAGADYQGGAMGQTLVPLLTSWPAAIQQGPKVAEGEVKLPGDVRMSSVIILLPASTDVELAMGDVVTTSEASPTIFTLSSVEETALGLRLTAYLATA